MAKISVSIDDDLLARIRDAADGQAVSAWIADAARQQLRMAAAREYVAMVEADSGPITEEELEASRRWLSSSATPAS